MLSFVPLAMLLVGGFGLFFDDEELRLRVVQAVFDNVPLSHESDRTRLEATVKGALDNTGKLGPISVLPLLSAASRVMGALRHAINHAWDIHNRVLPSPRPKTREIRPGAVVAALLISRVRGAPAAKGGERYAQRRIRSACGWHGALEDPGALELDVLRAEVS